MYDVLLKNGRIVDGCGNPWYKADVGIKEGRVARIGDLREAAAAPVHAGPELPSAGAVLSDADDGRHADLARQRQRPADQSA